MIKLIHPKTNVIREVDEAREAKIAALKRAGFVPFDSYKPKIVKEPEPEETLAEVVESQRDLKKEFPGVTVAAERAVHEKVQAPGKPEKETALASRSAQALIDKHGLDLSLIVGSGKEGKIIKPDVVAYMESMEPKEPEAPAPEEPSDPFSGSGDAIPEPAEEATDPAEVE